MGALTGLPPAAAASGARAGVLRTLLLLVACGCETAPEAYARAREIYNLACPDEFTVNCDVE